MSSNISDVFPRLMFERKYMILLYDNWYDEIYDNWFFGSWVGDKRS